MDDGMYGGKEVNAGMAVFLLKANHGMKDDQSPTSFTQINIGGGGKETKEIVSLKAGFVQYLKEKVGLSEKD
jgi:hypothetical protein